MTSSSPYLNREEQAMREAGQTTIRPVTAWVLVIVFLVAICAVPLIQQFHDVRACLVGERTGAWPQCYDIFRSVPAAFAVLAHTPGSLMNRVFAANRRLLRDMHAYEDALEDESVASRKLRPPVQYVMARWLGAGNEKAYCGTRPWLFYRADIEYLTGRGFRDPVQMKRRAASGNEWMPAPRPDPLPAILDFQRQLARRGIRLIVLPVPPKSVIQPDKFSSRFEPGGVFLQNPSYAAFMRELQQAGVLVADVIPAMAAVKGEAYLAADTHWRPEAMERAARYLKQYIDRNVPLPLRLETGYRAQAAGVTNRGDLAVMLRLPAWARGYPPESVRLHQVLSSRGESWRSEESSDILVLGDSFCNIYSLDAMGWGESAGLIEQLSFELQRPLDRLVINDNGAYATRALLARELARGRDRLANKRLVIWQFAMRELSSGDWRAVALALGAPVPERFVVPAPGKDMKVRGVVRALAPAPRPGTVPYKDHIVAMHLVDVASDLSAISAGQALVYLISMRDNVWTPAARLRPGDSVAINLRSWSDVALRYERINRTELPDEALQPAEPCWGELVMGQ